MEIVVVGCGKWHAFQKKLWKLFKQRNSVHAAGLTGYQNEYIDKEVLQFS